VMPVGIVQAPWMACSAKDYRTPAVFGIRGATAMHGRFNAMTVP